MIPLSIEKGKHWAVLGLGKAGKAGAAALKAGGAEVVLWDDHAAPDAAYPLTPPDAWPWEKLHGVLTAPGVPLSHPALVQARAQDCPVIGEVALLQRQCPHAHSIGITGTNGKSTTTALIGHILEQAGQSVQVGGNLGVPALALEPQDTGGHYVLELSSYQLDLFAPETKMNIAVWLNLTPDHLDRHGDMEGYYRAKMHIFQQQGPDDTAIIGVDDAWGAQALSELQARENGPLCLPFSVQRELPDGLSLLDGHLVWRKKGRITEEHTLPGYPALPGTHNAQNLLAAWAAARRCGIPAEQIMDATACFPGLAHRQEIVLDAPDLLAVNDSKATNADAAARALGCYENIYWIAGGRPKSGGISSLTSFFPRIRHAFLIGEAATDFAGILAQNGVAHQISYTLEQATRDALIAVRQDQEEAGRSSRSVILLSPACASFDQWPSFEARGDAFRCYVRKES